MIESIAVEWTSSGRERGQVLVVVATVMMLVLLGVAALTVDIGNGLLQKRRLQNVADAAALAAASEIARGGDEAAAALVAQNLVLTNTGNSVNPPYPASGGVNLTNGIEISGGEVRVALRKTDVRTFFAGVLGYQNMTVTARAHAGNNASSILPIAVKRYSAGQTTSQLGSDEQPTITSTTDQLSQGGSLVLNLWPSPPWPGLLTQGNGASAADGTNKGSVIPILGQEANPNTDHPEFHYFIAPDVRNITHPQVEYYNGTSGATTAQQLKNLEAAYFLPNNMGYSSAKLPVPGDQIAVLNGVVTGTAVSTMKQYFPPRSTVSAIVYDGTVQSAPDFRLRITPDMSASTIGTLHYTINLEQKSNPGLIDLSGVQFSLLGLDSANFATWNFNGSGQTASVPVNGGNVSLTLTVDPVWSGSPSAPAKGARTFVVKAYDPLTQITRTAMAAAIFDTTTSAFYAASSYSGPNDSTYQKVDQNSHAGSFKFNVDGYNYSGSVSDVGEDWTPTGGAATTSHSGVSISCGTASGINNNTKSMTCGVNTTATSETGEWQIKLTIGDGTSTRNQDLYLILRVVSNLSGIANTTDFVYVLGYANFEICYWDGSFTNQSPSHDSNTVFARAVSDITSSPANLTRSRQARLYPW